MSDDDEEPTVPGSTLSLSRKPGTRVELRCDRRGEPFVVKRTLLTRERECLQRVTPHPLISGLLRSGRDWIAVEAGLGGPLFRHIRRGLTVRAAQYYAAQVAVAIHHMHSRHVMHRDIKASNVLLDETGRVKIIDFGAAVINENHLRRTTLCGTPHAMAPEMLNGTYSFPVDWWALGVLFAEMISGNPPFWDDDPGKLKILILSGRPNLPVVPSDTHDVLTTLLSPDAHRRSRATDNFLGFGLPSPDQWRTIIDSGAPPAFAKDLGYLEWLDDIQNRDASSDSSSEDEGDDVAVDVFDGF